MSLSISLPAASAPRRLRLDVITPWILPVLILLAWQLGCDQGWITKRVLPSPASVLEEHLDSIEVGPFAYCTIEWLEVPDARLAKRIDQEGPTGLSSRLQRRLGCDFVVEVRSGQVPFLGRMIDVSMSGARISGAVGLRAGGQVEMRLLGGEPPLPSLLGRCDVIRAEPSGDTGVRFVRSDPTARIASGKLFLAVQEAWNKAPELTHSALCCKGGHVLEPPLPHMKHRI